MKKSSSTTPSSRKLSKFSTHNILQCQSTSQRTMSMQSRRKEKSANQLLSRISKPIPLTSPSTKPPQPKPQLKPKPLEDPSLHQSQLPQQQSLPSAATQFSPLPSGSLPPKQTKQPSKLHSKSPQSKLPHQQPKHTPSAALFDELFLGGDAPSEPMDNHFSNSWSNQSSNPLLDTETRHAPKLNFHNVFQSKPNLSSTPTPPFTSLSQSQQPLHKHVGKEILQTPIQKSKPIAAAASSIFATIKLQKNHSSPQDSDIGEVHMPSDPSSAQFNPVRSLRHHFNRTSTKQYLDPTQISLEQEAPSDESEYPTKDNFYDDDADLNTDKESEEQISDYEGYMQVLKERAADDTAFVTELRQYYKQFPHHKKLLHNTQLAETFNTPLQHPELEDMTDYEALGNALAANGGDEDGDDLFKPLGIEHSLEPQNQSKKTPAIHHKPDEDIQNAAKALHDNTVEVNGVRIPLRGLSRSQVEEFLQQEANKNTESEQEEVDIRGHVESLGFTPEELDSNRPKRLDYYKLPTHDQIPLIDTNSLDFKENKSILNWDVPWPEHTSTCDLSVRTCVLGTPNAGKSVIVNNLTRSRVTAVSAKRNTTRRRVLGISTEGNAQLTLYDTPGINEIHDAKRFQRDLATEAWDTVGDADLALVVLDAAKRVSGPELFLLHKCSDVKSNNPHLRWVLILNKVDLVDPKDRLLDILYRVQTLMPFDDCFMVSGLDGDGMADLEHYLYSKAVPREWEHSIDEKTDQSDIQLATELIRETLYHRLNKEIPYTVQQENVEWIPLAKGQLRIDQRLIVRREQHKRILVGSNGNALKNIQRAAEERLSTAFRRPVSLHLRVSVSVTQDFEGAV